MVNAEDKVRLEGPVRLESPGRLKRVPHPSESTSSPDPAPPDDPQHGDAPAAQTAVDARLWKRAGELFAAYQDGDSQSLDQLVHLLTPVLWHVVRAYGLSRDAAEDVVQTTWLTLVRSGSTIKDPQAVGKWLTITARRQAWRSRNQKVPDPMEDVRMEWHLGNAPSAENQVIQGLADQQLWALLQQLPERCVRLLRVIAFSDKPDYASLAGELNMPVGSIGPTRGRCLQRLKALITNPENGVRHD